MFRQVRDLANMLRPVTTALDLGQSDKTTIADACNIFMNLLNEPVLQDHHNNVQKRLDFIIKREGVADLKDEAFLPAAIAFQAEATPFPASFFIARGWASNPVTCVKALGSSSTGLPDGFIDFMMALQSAVASSAALE